MGSRHIFTKQHIRNEIKIKVICTMDSDPFLSTATITIQQVVDSILHPPHKVAVVISLADAKLLAQAILEAARDIKD